MTVTRSTFPLTSEMTIPAVGFGTYLIAPEDAAGAVLTALSLGYRHVDTAAGYKNEEAVGAGVRDGLRDAGLSREDLFVTTKLWPGHAGWGQPPKTGEETLVECAASLERLGMSYVDLYLIHSPLGGTERLGEWKALLELKRTGKARAVGVSNFSVKHLEEIKAAGLPMPDANQIELHPWSQKPELVAYLRAHGITPIAYSSLAPLSTWRTKPGQGSSKTEAMKQETDVFAQFASKYGVTEAQFLLGWGVQNGYPVLPKTLDPERMRQNIELDGFVIDAEDMALLRTMDRGDGVAWASGDPSYTE